MTAAVRWPVAERAELHGRAFFERFSADAGGQQLPLRPLDDTRSAMGVVLGIRWGALD